MVRRPSTLTAYQYLLILSWLNDVRPTIDAVCCCGWLLVAKHQYRVGWRVHGA